MYIILAAVGPVIDCQGKRFGTNEILNFDLINLDHHQLFNKLILSNNNIVLLPTHVLRNLKHLKELDLSQNHLDNIHADIFKDLNNLKDLDCSNNLLWSFDISILNAVSSLAKLNLSRNEISSLEKSSQNINTKLKVLDLSHNNLTDLRKDLLDSLTQIEYLDLSFNKLINLQMDSLVHLQHLRVFRINNNRLRFLNLQDLPSSLMELYAGNNFINILSLKESSIHILNLENNQISYLWENLTLLKEIRHLNLSGNSLSSFPEVVLKKIKLLDLSFNNLSIIPESISVKNFPMLKILSVSGNCLKDARIRSELRLEVFEANFVDNIEEINEEMFLKLKERKNECINVTISNSTRLRVVQESAFQHMNVCSVSISSSVQQ